MMGERTKRTYIQPQALSALESIPVAARGCYGALVAGKDGEISDSCGQAGQHGKRIAREQYHVVVRRHTRCIGAHGRTVYRNSLSPIPETQPSKHMEVPTARRLVKMPQRSPRCTTAPSMKPWPLPDERENTHPRELPTLEIHSPKVYQESTMCDANATAERQGTRLCMSGPWTQRSPPPACECIAWKALARKMPPAPTRHTCTK
ncbi:hypothetical protein BT67DRAFT_168881 [Trichocladium antarcticum]|uniref:Uncharacterized protein n=1 Tax=Trichocladium antarcticum TaxID=1450529 RepID=A0AAN6UE98_9PEZI|nr:hypothetical protein BT67DRAFT_168881 [Trichocladium antarcticum]